MSEKGEVGAIVTYFIAVLVTDHWGQDLINCARRFCTNVPLAFTITQILLIRLNAATLIDALPWNLQVAVYGFGITHLTSLAE
jgi:hypothetical protein